MTRRLVTLMAVATLALTLSAAPAQARGGGGHHEDSRGDHWVIVATSTQDLSDYAGTDMGGMLACGGSEYTIVSGFIDQVEMYRGKLDASGVAQGPGEAVETWTLRDVKVRDLAGRVHDGVGSSRAGDTWEKGATYGAGPFTSGSFIQSVRIGGTRDGRSFIQVLDPLSQSLVLRWDYGTCANLQVGLT
jgi:hypothetical protein